MMESYHKIWLEAHLDRTEEWLSERLKDGFDIHHLDGNHSNDEPGNLVLIEHTDHMVLHKTNMNRMKVRTLPQIQRERRERDGTDRLITAQEAIESQIQRQFFTTSPRNHSTPGPQSAMPSRGQHPLNPKKTAVSP